MKIRCGIIVWDGNGHRVFPSNWIKDSGKVRLFPINNNSLTHQRNASTPHNSCFCGCSNYDIECFTKWAFTKVFVNDLVNDQLHTACTTVIEAEKSHRFFAIFDQHCPDSLGFALGPQRHRKIVAGIILGNRKGNVIFTNTRIYGSRKSFELPFAFIAKLCFRWLHCDRNLKSIITRLNRLAEYIYSVARNSKLNITYIIKWPKNRLFVTRHPQWVSVATRISVVKKRHVQRTCTIS